MSRRGRIHIGTSGWSYGHWRGPFYPQDLPRDQMLRHYAARLGSVEINNTFYRLPEAGSLRAWGEAVPADFVFSVKASRYITHMKKLKDPAQSLSGFLGRIGVLGGRLGPVLFQLPPHWRFNADRLEAFLQALDPDLRYAFELRDRSWFDPRAYELLARHRAACCIYDLGGLRSPQEITTDFVYLRLHGPDGPYRGRYDSTALAGWADRFSLWSAQGLSVYCYFDNDERGYAALNAVELAQMLA